jgi:hypothetical protein
MLNLTPPRHTPTLPTPASWPRQPPVGVHWGNHTIRFCAPKAPRREPPPIPSVWPQRKDPPLNTFRPRDAFTAAVEHLGQEEARQLFRRVIRRPKRGLGKMLAPTMTPACFGNTTLRFTRRNHGCVVRAWTRSTICLAPAEVDITTCLSFRNEMMIVFCQTRANAIPAVYGFLVSERSLIPPSADKTPLIQAPRLSPGYRPRGSANPTRTPHQSVNRNHPH